MQDEKVKRKRRDATISFAALLKRRPTTRSLAVALGARETPVARLHGAHQDSNFPAKKSTCSGTRVSPRPIEIASSSACIAPSAMIDFTPASSAICL